MALRWASIFHASRGEALKLEEVVVGVGGWRGNTKEQDLYYLTTYIYNDKIFIVFYGKL